MVDDSSLERPTHLLARLEHLNNRIAVEMGRRMASSGLAIRGSQGRILNLVSASGSRPTELAEGAWVSKQAIGRRIRDLAERGLVRLDPDPGDGRALLVFLTPAGEQARATLLQQISAMERQFARELGGARYRQLLELLDRLAADASSGAEPLRGPLARRAPQRARRTHRDPP